MSEKLKRRAQDIVSALHKRKLTVITAESCTGGMLAATLSEAEGASDVLHGGFVTYTKVHKTTGLGVSASVLREQGAVNDDVACQLASGALERSPATVAIAVTGVMGPEEDEDGNPVGRVYLCARRRGSNPIAAHEEFGKRERDEMCTAIILRAFDLLEQAIGT